MVVVGGGAAPAAASLPPSLRDPGVFVVAADSGVDVAEGLGLAVHLAVGDFDSVTADGLRRARARGAVVERHPAAKDETDLELALRGALDRRPQRIVVVGGGGGRLDHLLGNLGVLTAPFLAGVNVTAHLAEARLTVVRPGRPADLIGAPGDLVTLLPVHGSAAGVVTDGLRYPLCDEALPAGTSRGVSNVLDGSTASVSISRGVLLAIQPTTPPSNEVLP